MNWLATASIDFLAWVLACTPRRLRICLGQFLGLLWFYVVRVRRSVVLANLRLAFPQKSQAELLRIAKENYKNYGCGFLELLMLPRLNKKMFDNLCILEGYEHYLEAARRGQGVFFLTLHLGSWELMSAVSQCLNIPLHVITKKFKAQGLNQIWVNLRKARGLKLISEEKSTFEILRAIKRGEVVGFILDQFMGPPVGVRVNFFGSETGAPAALALFADRTRAPVVPVYNVRQADGRLRIIFEKPIPFMEQCDTKKNISFMTQVYTSKIQTVVEKYPEQWLWLHRRWKAFRE